MKLSGNLVMLVLGIETSCDETAAAIVQNGRHVLSNVVASQIELHRQYGGVVPEIASRKHMEVIVPVILQAMHDAHVAINDLDGIAVTRGPGLVGSLLVGLSVGKAMAYARKKPFVGVNHLEGHIASIYLEDKTPDFPFVALVVSGGHTSIYLVEHFSRLKVLGKTRDDAAGEAFDKAAKLMNIGYPGGVVIDRLAKGGNRNRIPFPRAMKDTLDFSFSGLKTSLLNYTKKTGRSFKEDEIQDIAASYQEAIVDVLVEKTFRAAQLSSVSSIVVCGGVAANSRLREKFAEMSAVSGVQVFFPAIFLCTDNAAMIAVVGNHLLERGRKDSLDLNAISRWPEAHPA
jgi:N6-L-threonylcarbamoyladenine synthase